MMTRYLLIAILCLVPASAQTKSKATTKVPRTAAGKPDLTGVWQGGSTAPGNWEEANRGIGLGGTGVDANAPGTLSSSDKPANREPAPYQPWAAKKVLEAYNKRGIDDPTALCLPAGVPRTVVLGLFPQQFIQTPTQIVMLYEYMNQYRIIPFAAKHPDDVVPTYMGDSIAHWEGDTLIVDTIGFNSITWLVGTGTFHTEALHVTERFTRVDKDRINYDVTMEDPNVLTKPWTIHTSMMLREGTRVREYTCIENNLDPGRYDKLLKDGVSFSRQ